MDEIKTASRVEDLEKMNAEAQKLTGVVELLTVYGGFNDVMSIGQEYLNAFQVRTSSTVSNSSSL